MNVSGIPSECLKRETEIYNRDLAFLWNTLVAMAVIIYDNYALSRGGAAR